MVSHRRESVSWGFVHWPTVQNPPEKWESGAADWDAHAQDGYWNTGEGGMEVWLLAIPEPEGVSAVRGVCMTGFHVGVLEWNAVTTPWWEKVAGVTYMSGKVQFQRVRLDGAVCVGASGLSIWDAKNKAYWQPSYGDLTGEGKKVFDAMASLYGYEPSIVVALDT